MTDAEIADLRLLVASWESVAGILRAVRDGAGSERLAGRAAGLDHAADELREWIRSKRATDRSSRIISPVE